MKYRKQSGVALIAAIFLVVVIGTAVTLLAVLSSRNSQLSTQSLLQIRAQLAANAGLEATIQNIILNPTGFCATAPSETNINVTVPAYSDYAVTVSCQIATYNRNPQEISLYNLVGQAEFGNPNNADYVWAEVTATMEL